MKWSWKIGRLAGIDVRVHVTFFLLVAWVAWGNYVAKGAIDAAVMGVLFVLLLFGIVVLHELGHALMARRYGVPTRDITLLPIGGVARLERMPENPRHELAVAVAGPAVNIVLAVVLGGLGWLLGADMSPNLEETSLLGQLLWVNVALATFNMLPAFPLDGGRALRATLAMRMDDLRATEFAATLGRGLAVMLGVVGLFGNPVLVLIALFVWFGAKAEATSAQLKDALAGIPVGEAAIRDFRTVSPSDPVATAVQYALAGFQHDFPVVEGNEVVGVLPHVALLEALAERGAGTPVAQVMTPAPPTVHRADSLERVLPKLQAAACRCLPVVDDVGGLVGVLTVDAVGELVAVRQALRHSKPAAARF